MLDELYSGFSAIAAGVQMLIDILRLALHWNYEFVVSVVQAVTEIATWVVSVYTQIKLFAITTISSILDFVLKIYTFFALSFNLLWKLIMSVSQLIHTCYANITTFCLTCTYYASSTLLMLKHFMISAYVFFTTTASNSASLVVSGITSFFLIITAVGSICVNFVTGVWQGLGFVLSSVALFPVYCVQCIEDLWTRLTTAVADTVLATTKETYLGIVVLCLVYLTLSNTLRYMYCRGLSLFPRRLRTRRSRSNRFYWQFDPGFESDFEDTMIGSDTDDRLWMNDSRDDMNNDTDDEDSDQDSNHSNNSDDISDDDNDSDEYTVVTEESDSDASINSQTFSTESSDHEIEVQLPPVDERYSLRSRSSTPSRVPKSMNSEEEFNREMERERDKRKCVVCQDAIKSVLVLPCRHMCMCILCADQIVRSRLAGRRVCPLCRTKITKVMNIYV